MPSFKARFALTSTAVCLFSNLLFAAPALTTIQDVLYKADGTKFNGLLQITWNSFQAADATNVATQRVSVQVNNGYLHVLLVPTTNAATAAVYNVVYNSDGAIQFTEVWVVPPSTSPLRVSDVRSTSTAGAAAALTQIQVTDVAGLRTELTLRPTMGPSFAPARAAIIDSNGGLDAAIGNLSDCVHVDGTSGACGGSTGGTSTSFADAEMLSGIVDGVNTTFQLANVPSPAASVVLFRNGLALTSAVDFSVSGSTITFLVGSVPQPGDVLQTFYRTGSSGSSGSSGGSGSGTTTIPTSVPSCSLYTLSNNGTNWTISVNGASATVGAAIVNSTAQDIPLVTLPARSVVTGIREKTTVSWSGATITTLNLLLSDSVGGYSFYTPPNYDLMAPVTNTNFRATQLFKAGSDAGSTINAHVSSNMGLNATRITGSVDIDVCSVTLP